MTIKKQKVQPYMTNIYCDKCDKIMVKNPCVLATYPATYSYSCPECGKTEQSHTLYPSIEYEVIHD